MRLAPRVRPRLARNLLCASLVRRTREFGADELEPASLHVARRWSSHGCQEEGCEEEGHEEEGREEEEVTGSWTWHVLGGALAEAGRPSSSCSSYPVIEGRWVLQSLPATLAARRGDSW